MQLNLPILEQLDGKQNILIAGAGGGFDVFAGLPLYFALREMGKTVHLANYSFVETALLEGENLETIIPTYLVGAKGIVQGIYPYYPEGYLAEWFAEVYGDPITLWMFGRQHRNIGAIPLKEAYEELIKRLRIDALILVDGGVDSLMHGDEEAPGTIIEDTISLAAVADVDIPVKLLACLGFGAELEVAGHHALENMATLIKDGGFLGSCALIKQMPVYQQYEAACRYVWEKLDGLHAKSHINMRVVSATQGEFGNHHLYDDPANRPVFVSPIMSLYWFFDATVVIRHSHLVEWFKHTRDTADALHLYTKARLGMGPIRPAKKIPY